MLHTENLEPTSCSSYDELLFSHVHPYVVTREALCASVTSTCFNTHCLYWMYVRTFCRERPGVLLRRPCGHEAASVLMLLRNSININQSTISQHWSSLKARSSTQNGTDCKQYSNSHYRCFVLWIPDWKTTNKHMFFTFSRLTAEKCIEWVHRKWINPLLV